MHNPAGALRVVVTKPLPGDRWLQVLTAAGARVEVCTDGSKCDGVIGQLTEVRRVAPCCEGGWRWWEACSFET